MRIALVHDWLITWRGGEKVLEALLELMPRAELFTLFHDPAAMPASIERHDVHTAFVDKLPFARRRHRELLPLLPLAVKTLDLRGFELVVSSSHCVAKAARSQGAKHVAYVHAPLRYFWDRFDDYFGAGRAPLPVRVAALAMRPFMQSWDVKSSRGIDRFIANSAHVARQIAQRYGERAEVVHPPVELERFTREPLPRGQGEAFLCFGALAPYKRIDVAIEAFRRNGLPLWVAGAGQLDRALRRNLPPNVKWLGAIDDAQLPHVLKSARALVFPGEEDFGLTPIEAQACGRPVIAFGKGGALETVVHEKTGVFFYPQTPDALARAVFHFVEQLEGRLSPGAMRENALRFSKAHFFAGMRAQLDVVAPGWSQPSPRGS
ncbi:MAG: glycosyltransferase [Myxococcaceae bacterium]|nr:glycosyltransferase [Myxococcaceae bacterium]